MPEKSILFDSGGIKIEGLLENLAGDKGVVVTHPHPLYGGDMHNNVVEAVCGAYREKGYSSLRFNFRGVGGSEGEYEDGIGEQEDIEAAVDYLSHLGIKEIDLVGYSFGSWVNALGINRYTKVKRMIMVSPPADMMDFSSFAYTPKLKLVIAGMDDEFGSVETIKRALEIWNPDAEFKIIQGADHFYWGKTGEIQSKIKEFLDSVVVSE